VSPTDQINRFHIMQREQCRLSFCCEALASGFFATIILTTTFVRVDSRSLRYSNDLTSQGYFETLTECQFQFDGLQEECRSCKKQRSSWHGFTGRTSGAGEKDLMADSDGRNKIVTDTVEEIKRSPRTLYLPPESITGKPNGNTGWDYKVHGDDWLGFGTCSGLYQSPVDLSKHVDTPGQTKYVLWFDYYQDPNVNASTKALLINDGHGLRYDVLTNGIDLGFVKIGNEEYQALEYIFHAPSEHTIDGAVFPVELQIYNKEVKGKGMVAISILFREGDSNDFLFSLMDAMGGTAPRWSKVSGSSSATIKGTFPGAFDLEKLIPKGRPSTEKAFFNYEGSLTQPPCTEGVDWWVLSSPIPASREQIRIIRRAIFGSSSMRHGNARSSMPLRNRSIFVGLTGFQHYTGPKGLGNYRGYYTRDHPWKFNGLPPGPPEVDSAPMPSPAFSPAPDS